MDKKLIKIIAIVVGSFVILMIILLLIAGCSKKKLNYSDIEDTMIQAAKRYYKSHEKELPDEDGDTKTINLKKLVSDGYMDAPSKTYKDDNLNCDGNITVTNNDQNYLYSPNLTCGKNYKTTLLKDRIISDSLVETGAGLYESGDQYIFKGENNSNYININDKILRIVRINEDGTIRVMETTGLSDIIWDDRFNNSQNKLGSVGLNDYYNKDNSTSSRIKETLENYYNDDTSWPQTLKSYIVTQTLCIGKRTTADITKDGSTECSTTLTNQRLGLLAAYEFMQASLDNDCTQTDSFNCMNYNWYVPENISDRFWTLTGNAENTSGVYYVNHYLRNTDGVNTNNLRAVFNLSDKLVYVSGDGSEGNPYIVK